MDFISSKHAAQHIGQRSHQENIAVVCRTEPARSEPHAITRARERFGLNLTIDDLRQIVAKIVCKLSKLQARLPGGCERHAVHHRDVILPVVFDPERGLVVTILPPSVRFWTVA